MEIVPLTNVICHIKLQHFWREQLISVDISKSAAYQLTSKCVCILDLEYSLRLKYELLQIFP